jgi:MFS family permease
VTGDLPPLSEPLAHPAIAGGEAQTMTAGRRRRSLTAVLASMLAVGLTFGTAIPLISLRLDRMGVASSLIGLNASMALLATVLLSPFMPRLVRRLGTLPALFGALAVIVTGFLLMPLLPSLGAWFALRFLVGIGMAVHWVVSETWLNAAAPAGRRGLYAGLYATLMGAGFAAGPALLTVVDIEGATPFLMIAGFVAAAALPLILAAGAVPSLEMTVESGRWSALRAAPTIFAGIFVSGLVDTAILSLLPIYGLRSGLAQDDAIILLSVAIAGTVVLQLPIGWLADRIGARRLLLASGILGLVGAAALPAALAMPTLRWAILFVWGGVVAGLYTLGLTDLGRRFTGGALADANALFVMVYCLGSLAGPTVTGLVMDTLGPVGFPITLTTVFALFLAVGAIRTLARRGR